MNFSCNKCQRRYSIADDKVRGKTVKVRCKNCQNVISVEGPPVEEQESTRVVSLADVERLREQDRSLAAEEESAAAAVAQQAVAAGSAQSWEDEPTRTMPLRDSRSPWFVMVKSKQEGPLDEGALSELVASGAVTARSYFWQQGMPDWKRGQDIPELAGFFAAPEAPPPAAPPPPVRAAPPPVREPEPELEPVPAEKSATSWQPEPPAPSQTTWQTSPTQRRPVPVAKDATPWEPEPESQQTPAPASDGSDANGAPLGALFSDLDLPQSEPQGELGPDMLAGAQQEDPLAALGKEPEAKRAQAENTQYFVKKAGVHRRNPPWKIALFIVLLLGVPVGVLYALTELQVVPLRVTRVDARGNTVQEPVSVFSSEGMSELRDLMLGRSKPPPPPPPPAPKPKARPSEPVKQEPPQEVAQPAAEAQQGVTQQEAAALYAEGEKKDVGPEVRENTEVAATDSSAQSGPPQEAIARVVAQSQSAFKSCIETALRKNPKLRDGKLLLTATVGSSGTVKKVSFDRSDLDSSPMGNCIKGRAKRMVFPSFSGDDVEVEIPLVLSKSM
ncbi:AgmX/PglI C-terminal domain-containing protein [Archangium violaceum]|uniref:AgmX/PglI C-terminal domain-containing protein n=1 Tax=Archangium violaceum TaxID=83451 RepID=UPI002B3003AF|nr:AgmX/PglI C-terminal domain-containing protein [Archangium violaceum]